MNGTSVISPIFCWWKYNRNLIEFFLWYFFSFLISVLSSYLCAIINLFIRIMHSTKYVLYNSECSLQFIKVYYFSVQSLSHVQLFATPRTVAHQASLSITNARSLLKLMSIKSVMPSNHLILCHPLSLPPSIFPSIRVFSNKSVLHIRWPKYWSFSFSISPSSEYSGLISFRVDWLNLLAVQGISHCDYWGQTTVLKSSGLLIFLALHF